MYEQQVVSTKYLGLPISFCCANTPSNIYVAICVCLILDSVFRADTTKIPTEHILCRFQRRVWIGQFSAHRCPFSIVQDYRSVQHTQQTHSITYQARLLTKCGWSKINWKLFSITEENTLPMYQCSTIQGF